MVEYESARGAAFPASDARPSRIDAHHHVWDLSVRAQPWTAGLDVLERSYTMADLEPALATRGIAGTVLVQTVAVSEETPEMLGLASRNALIRGVVGWVDLAAPDVSDVLASLLEGPGGDYLVGIRHGVEGQTYAEWLQRPEVLQGLAAVANAGLSFDLLLGADQLPLVVDLVEQVPGLRWILDHAGNPPIAEGGLDPWRTHVAALAQNPMVACKVSGLVTLAADSWTREQIAPYADHVLEAFGPERIMIGSDWPVCLLGGSYVEVDELADQLIGDLTAHEQVLVRGGSAETWYRLPRRDQRTGSLRTPGGSSSFQSVS